MLTVSHQDDTYHQITPVSIAHTPPRTSGYLRFVRIDPGQRFDYQRIHRLTFTSRSAGVTNRRPPGRDDVLFSFNRAIEALNLAEDNTRIGIALAKSAFGSVSILLTMIKVRSFSYDRMSGIHIDPGLDG